MASDSRHLSVLIERPAAEVYGYVRDYRNLPAWAAGLASGVRLVAGRWLADSPLRSAVDPRRRNARDRTATR